MTKLVTYEIQAEYDGEVGGYVATAPPGKIVTVDFSITAYGSDGIYLVTVSR